MAKEIREIIARQNRLTDPENRHLLDDIHKAVDKAETSGALAKNLNEIAKREAELKALQDSNTEREITEAVAPYILEYKSKPLTPDLVNRTWQGIWTAIGDRVGFEYQVPSCDRTTEELAKLKEEDKALLLLPDDIYTPEGFVRLGKAIPLIGRWADLEMAERISHKSTKGGSIDIEMNLESPHMRSPEGYNEEELGKIIESEGRHGQRLPTYVVGSLFSKLLTGHYFDERETDTMSRLLGTIVSEHREEVQFASCYKDNFGQDRIELVSWGPQYRAPDLGGRSEGFKRV